MAKKKETLQLVAKERDETGSRRSRQLRLEGWIPCVMYGTTVQPRSLKVNRHELEMIVEHHGGQNVIFDLDIGGEIMENMLLKDLQRDPVTNHAVHADFLKITMTQKLRVLVSIKLTGEPVGVSKNGGILEHQTRSVEVECLPSDIVKEFALDTTALDIEDRLFVRDIPADPRLTILTPADTVIASVHMPKLEEEEAKPEEEAAEEAAEAAPGADKEKDAETAGAAEAEKGKPDQGDKGKGKGEKEG